MIQYFFTLFLPMSLLITQATCITGGVEVSDELEKQLNNHVLYLASLRYCAKPIFIPPTLFSHPIMLTTLDALARKNIGAALCASWYTYRRYSVDQENLFLKEFSQLLLIIYHSLLTAEYKPSFSDVVSLYSHISLLPTREILILLDQARDQLTAILSEYPLEDMSLGQWLQKYWWVPPVACISLLVSIMQWYVLKEVKEVVV